jgi:glycosyltransferase involved in cell wall biosynthesis
MKIGIYSPYLNTMGGGERYMLTIASCLQEDNDVSLFWDDKNVKTDAEKRLGISLEKVSVEPNIFSNSNVIKKVYQTHLFDVMVMLSDGSIPLSFSKRNILHFQQPFYNINGRSLFTQLKLKNIHSILCNSSFTKKFIDLEFRVLSHVVYPPVDTSIFLGLPQQKEHIIISVGRFHPVKKHSVLVSAFQKITNKQNWKLVLAGGLLDQDTKYFSELKKSVSGKNIELHPNISYLKLIDLYKVASIYWHATGFGEDENNHPERMEHFGISPVEAMASGCIPLLYKGGGLPEIISNLGDQYLWSIESELIDKTEQLISNNKSMLNRRKELLDRSKLFDVTNFCTEIRKYV